MNRTDTPCVVPECDRFVDARMMCSSHYSRWRRGVDVPGVARRVDTPLCGASGCTHAATSRGLCFRHHHHDVRGRVVVKSAGLCSFADCYHLVNARGLCTKHYQRTKTTPERVREANLWTHYRMTVGQYEQMLAAQGGVCAICGRVDTRRLAVDHDHSCCPGKRSCGRCVRGLLCTPCNNALGWLQDSTERLRAAAVYLERGQ